MLTMDTRIAPNTAGTNPVTTNGTPREPATREVRISMNAFSTRVKSPSVTNWIGMERNDSTGRTKALMMPKTIATITSPCQPPA